MISWPGGYPTRCLAAYSADAVHRVSRGWFGRWSGGIGASQGVAGLAVSRYERVSSYTSSSSISLSSGSIKSFLLGSMGLVAKVLNASAESLPPLQ